MVYKSYPCTGLGMPLGLKEVGATRISRYMNLVRLSALRTGRLYTPRGTPVTHFCWSLNRPQGQTTARRIKSIKNHNNTIGNRTREQNDHIHQHIRLAIRADTMRRGDSDGYYNRKWKRSYTPTHTISYTRGPTTGPLKEASGLL
jgi:hypothetical protein